MPHRSVPTSDGIVVTRLAPNDQTLQVSFRSGEKLSGARFFAEVRENDALILRKETESCDFLLTDLPNGRDCSLRIVAEDGGGTLLAQSCDRRFRTNFVPGVVVAYLHPADHTYVDSGNTTCSPSICRLDNGELLVSHDFFRSKGGQHLTHLYRSRDNGATWEFASAISPCFWGSLFTHRGAVYLLCTSTEYGALQIYRSTDGGEHWEGPVKLLEAGSREAGGPHKAPMAVIAHGGRLWTAVEFGSWDTEMHCPGAVSADENADLMDPTSWLCTGFLPYDAAKLPEISGHPRGGTIEGNLLVTPDGELVDLLRFSTRLCQPSYGKAYLTRVTAPDQLMEFVSTVDFPGNLSKFFILQSPADGRYYALSNPVTGENLLQRNVLRLSVSDDLLHWTTVRDILNYEDNCFGEDSKKVGFQYPSFIFDGDDILAAVRTALNGAENFHNANHITFHRIRNYRKQ